MGSLLCCIPEILRLLTERLWPMTNEPLIEEPLAVEPKAKKEETESSKTICKPLPEELVTDILSRLPADSLHQCAEVYRDWNSLFSTHYFIHDLFLPRASPTIIVHRISHIEDELFYLDDFGGNYKKTPISIKIDDDPLICGLLGLSFSCFGLLFFTNPHLKYAAVLNPVTCEKTYLLHDCTGLTEICGVYYHPIAQEFCVLFVSCFMGNNDYIEFKLLRERRPSGSWNKLSSISYLPPTRVPPVNLNGALHWMHLYPTRCSHSFVVFSIAEEEFKLMPHPGVVPILNPDGSKKVTHLFDLNGNLALCQIEDVLEIWTLKDYTSWFWTKTHSIKLEGLDHLKRSLWVYVLGAQNGALIIRRIGNGNGIFTGHLQLNTTKNFIFDELKGLRRVCLHTKSLISLRAFQPSSEKYQELLRTATKCKLKEKTSRM